MKDRNFQRETTKKGSKKGAGRPITYGADMDEQIQSATCHKIPSPSESSRADYSYPTSVPRPQMAGCKNSSSGIL